MGMALSGLASGFDWKSIVDQLIEVSRAPQTRMRKEQTTNSQKSSALEDVRGKLAALKTSISNLNSQDSLLKKSATIADKTSNWSATATRDTPAGDYNVEMISQATATVLRGKQDLNLNSGLNVSDQINSKWIGTTITPGFFTVNGKQINVDSSRTWGAVINDIQAAGVSVAVDPGGLLTGDILQLSSSNVIQLGSATDTSNFLQAARLYGNGTNSVQTLTETDASVAGAFTSTNGLTSLRLDAAIGSSQSGLYGSGTITTGSSDNYSLQFTVNGELINFNKDNTTQDILDKINASNAGVSASYDRKYDQIVLRNKKSGNLAINVVDTVGRAAETLGIAKGGGLYPTTRPFPAQILGQNATFRINDGGTLQAQSSTLTETDHGIKGLTINANSLSPAGAIAGTYTPTKITVAGDTSAAKDALNDFVAKYNSVQDTIERYTKVTTSGSKVTSSILSGNRELSDIARKLRTELYTSSGLTGTVNRLSDLGVTSSGIQNTVSFNSSVLEAKLASASDDVNAFFKDTGTSAFMTRIKTNFLDKMITDAGSATGGLQAQLTSFTKQNTNLDKQIEEVERRLASQRSTLEASFIAMEKAQSRFQQQGSYLAKTFANQN